jgi:hypothetical protein
MQLQQPQQHFVANPAAAAAAYGAGYMPTYTGSHGAHGSEFGISFSSAGYPVALPATYPSGHYFFGENCGFYPNNNGLAPSAGCQQQQYQQVSPAVVERSISTSSSPEFDSQQIEVKPDLLSESYSDHSSPRQDWSPLTPPTGV